MAAKLIVVLVIAMVFEAVGVVFLSKGLKEIGTISKPSFSEIARVVGLGITNKNILLGVFFEALFFAGLLTLMSKGDVSFVWPLTSLGFVLTTLAARFFLNEHVPPMRWAGVLLIMLGAGLITYSEQVRTKKLNQEALAASQSEHPQ